MTQSGGGIGDYSGQGVMHHWHSATEQVENCPVCGLSQGADS